MTDNFIQLKKDDVLKLRIKTSDGKDTGEYLEFDLEDIELPLRYQELIEINKKNKQNLKNKLFIISKKQDVKGKKLLSKNEEESIKAIKKFFDDEVEVYNMFLGENGVQKLLNGRKIGWSSLQKIDEIIEKQITPYFDLSMKGIEDKIKNKYDTIIGNDKELK